MPLLATDSIPFERADSKAPVELERVLEASPANTDGAMLELEFGGDRAVVKSDQQRASGIVAVADASVSKA